MASAQIKQTQFVFREVNERIADITREREEAASEFICECGREDCVETIALPLVDYKALREAEEHFFIAAPGHCLEGVDRIVESRGGFDIVVEL